MIKSGRMGIIIPKPMTSAQQTAGRPCRRRSPGGSPDRRRSSSSRRVRWCGSKSRLRGRPRTAVSEASNSARAEAGHDTTRPFASSRTCVLRAATGRTAAIVRFRAAPGHGPTGWPGDGQPPGQRGARRGNPGQPIFPPTPSRLEIRGVSRLEGVRKENRPDSGLKSRWTRRAAWAAARPRPASR